MADEFILDERALSEMSSEEIIAEINKLRARRQVARERRAVESLPGKEKTSRKTQSEIGGALGAALDDIFADDTAVCEKCGKVLQDGICPNLSCE